MRKFPQKTRHHRGQMTGQHRFDRAEAQLGGATRRRFPKRKPQIVEHAVQALHSAFELSGPGTLGEEQPFKARQTL